MKKDRLISGLTPPAVFIAVFAVCQLRLRYTFISLENNSLFLWTPDYLASHKVWDILLSFVLQFFRFPYVGALTVAALAALLCLAAIRIRRSAAPVCLAVTAVLLAVVCVDGRLSKCERWAKIEYGTRQHDWRMVVETATPERAAEDREMIPFALLALGELGELQEHLCDYPVNGPEDMDMEGVATRRGYFFSSILYECLGCPNEAIHHTFQSACCLPSGNSFLTLRQLVRYNLAAGDYRIVRKYCAVLGRSPANRGLARTILASLPSEEDFSGTRNPKTDSSLVITHNPIYNLFVLEEAGIRSSLAADRFKAYTRIQKSLAD